MPKYFPEVEHEHRSYYTIMSRHRDISQWLVNQEVKIFKQTKRDKVAEVAKKLKSLNESIDHDAVVNQIGGLSKQGNT